MLRGWKRLPELSPRGRTRVPVASIQFALSFLFAGDNALLAQVLELKGAHVVEHLVAVFTELLHSQREALALCLMFQLYDQDLVSLKVADYPQLRQFNQNYKLCIPKQSQEPVVWNI